MENPMSYLPTRMGLSSRIGGGTPRGQNPMARQLAAIQAQHEIEEAQRRAEKEAKKAEVLGIVKMALGGIGALGGLAGGIGALAGAPALAAIGGIAGGVTGLGSMGADALSLGKGTMGSFMGQDVANMTQSQLPTQTPGQVSSNLTPTAPVQRDPFALYPLPQQSPLPPFRSPFDLYRTPYYYSR